MSSPRNSCPKCRGSIRMIRDRYGYFFNCLQCGYQRAVPDVQWGHKPARARPNPFAVEAKKLAEKRGRRDQPPLL